MSPSAEPDSAVYNGLDPKNPFNKLWRGSKDGSIRLQPMPKFDDPYAEHACVFYDNHSVYGNFGGVVLATEEGKNIARALGPKNKTCILQNHGLLTLGTTVDEAARLFTALDKQCHVMLLTAAASSSGLKPNVIGKEEAEYTARFLQEPEITYSSFQPEYNILVEETNGAFLL
ncbi:hypothetical protein C0992_010778 [Termitomyces sp. T32_za158]|nr:hypothetical protein C0992_010778 [Termitomyces sp. T32_za158]